MNKQRVSPFEYIPGISLEEEHAKNVSITEEQLEKYFKEKVYQRTEYALLESLYRLPYLTKKNMERFVDYRLKDRKYTGYDNVLKQLEQDGCLRRFVYDDVRFYRLQDGAREYFEKKLDPNGLHKIHIPSEHDTPAVLERAALAQWHLSVMLGGNVRKAYFGEEVSIRKKKIQIPSYQEVEKGSVRYRILSFSVPKVGMKMESFMDNIIKVKEALYKWELSLKREIFLIVLVCSNTQEMLLLANIFENLPVTAKLQVYFVAEQNTAFSKGIDLLYTATKEGEKLVLKTISVKQ